MKISLMTYRLIPEPGTRTGHGFWPGRREKESSRRLVSSRYNRQLVDSLFLSFRPLALPPMKMLSSFLFVEFRRFAALSVALMLLLGSAATAAPLKVLIIDGFNPYHDWQKTTPVLRQILEDSGLFSVTVMTAPQDEAAMRNFNPDFADYDLFVSNYNGLSWNEPTQERFDAYVAGGGGFVSVHAADNAFPQWSAYNRMIGLGGWGGRNEKSGPYVRWDDRQGRFSRDNSPGGGGSHGKRVPFLVICRDQDHPITRGIPSSFLQVEDELYSKLRGP